ncbi:metallophosphoesterase [Leptospira sp. 2 VSF19]|uniref:Metallophosphoesterase n=1 Tax=Leptospira soteropolitanensis TaxID=2950025 RepID=A0AAW5VHX0_9LEPT|nr:metallophosphoesterase [Leptospira soteropolitanensis]MCW7494658.1 metallophosphoesterase [Leptospira soteropolitanensis]MCW7499996.1 metallophosphoesterase [Leptospira soteropolitanensis]MCW7522247.1 metallophosphoesterase [Leptospira soteropolitanensis]MCW7526103.1 metallophosphoesterase [Leptospira soteropolitanensis]MCW7529785.1 metallophosphoesterase [Leptospira soteropolitanensis]
MKYEKTIAIGDVHACSIQLKELLFKLEIIPDALLLFMGDYINYGTQNRETIDILRSLNRKAIFLFGNHEEWLLKLWEENEAHPIKRKQILKYYNFTEVHLNWFKENLVYSYENDYAFFSHAGIDDRNSLKEQTKYDLLNSAFRENLDHVTSKLIIQGHIPFNKVVNYGNHWFLDTKCGLGGKLSALVVPSMQVITS